ncbi:MAG TPA: diguanylate cyclase [Plasticicumulans sp.]|nr:diguanylate cyclase [Plasticicumulans sp.]
MPAPLTRWLLMFRTSSESPASGNPGPRADARRRLLRTLLSLLLLWGLVLIAVLQLRALQGEHADIRLQRISTAVAAETGRRFEAIGTLLGAAQAWATQPEDTRPNAQSPYPLLTSGCRRELGAGCRLLRLDAEGRLQPLHDDSGTILPARPLPLPAPGVALIAHLEAVTAATGTDLLLYGVAATDSGAAVRAVYAAVPVRDFIDAYATLPPAGEARIELLHADGSPLLEILRADAVAAAGYSRIVALTPLPLRLHVSLPAPPLYQDWRLAAALLIAAAGLYSGRRLLGLRQAAGKPGDGVEPDTLLALRQSQRLGRGGHWVYDARLRTLKLSDELRALLSEALAANLQPLAAGDDVTPAPGTEQLHSDLQRAIVNECEFAGEYRVSDARDQPQWLSVHADASYNSEGRYLGHIAYVQDITGRKQLELELRRLATTDSLTGILNRGSFLDRTAEEIARARRYGRPLSLIVLDLDDFKTINDRFGHPVGDQCLRAFAETGTACLRRADRLGRLGGEEFAALLPETGLPAALGAAERIREHVQRLRVPLGDGLDTGFTVSAGVTLLSDHHQSIEQLLAAADRALYRAKAEGRNRVCLDNDLQVEGV